MHALSIKHQSKWEKAFDPNVAEMKLRGMHLLYFLESKGQHNVGLRNQLTLFTQLDQKAPVLIPPAL
jgi:hypothetical protein